MTAQKEETMSANDPMVQDLIYKLSILLHRREVTPEEIYEAFLACNDNDHQTATFIRDKAVMLSESYNTQLCSMLN